MIVADSADIQFASEKLESIAENPQNYEDAFLRLPNVESDLI